MFIVDKTTGEIDIPASLKILEKHFNKWRKIVKRRKPFKVYPWQNELVVLSYVVPRAVFPQSHIRIAGRVHTIDNRKYPNFMFASVSSEARYFLVNTKKFRVKSDGSFEFKLSTNDLKVGSYRIYFRTKSNPKLGEKEHDLLQPEDNCFYVDFY